MAEPFKNWINRGIIEGMAGHFDRHYADFDAASFIHDAADGLELLELKQRTDRITDTMITYLPEDFEQAGAILLASLGTTLEDDLSVGKIDSNGIAGWAIMSMAHYVALQGHDHLDLSMTLLKEMTKRSTAEFAIRYFLLNDSDKTLPYLKDWALDNDQHVRRLASEGSRPRLPWGMRLPVFVDDPSAVIELLEMLKDDDSEYVRRSVANNLNDIAKDHPEWVAEIAEQWLADASKERVKLVRHACRTLIKNGHPKTLAAFGYKPAEAQQATIEISTPQVIFGEALEFMFSLDSASDDAQPLLIDYVIHHQKANGTTSPKVFKWKTTNLAANKSLSIDKKHPMKKITTRQYYAGKHSLEIMVNGVSMGKTDFELLMV